MRKIENMLKTSFVFLTSAILIICLLSSFTMIANAEGESQITPAMQEIIDDINKLPKDSAQITMKHKEAIYTIKEKYEALSDDEKITFPQDKFNIYTISENALMPYVIDNIATRIEGLKDNLKKNDKDKVLEIYDDYSGLSDIAKSTLSEKYTKRLTDAVDAVSGEKKGTNTAAVKINFEKIVIIVLSCLIAVNLILFVMVVVKLLLNKKERANCDDKSN